MFHCPFCITEVRSDYRCVNCGGIYYSTTNTLVKILWEYPNYIYIFYDLRSFEVQVFYNKNLSNYPQDLIFKFQTKDFNSSPEMLNSIYNKAIKLMAFK